MHWKRQLAPPKAEPAAEAESSTNPFEIGWCKAKPKEGFQSQMTRPYSAAKAAGNHQKKFTLVLQHRLGMKTPTVSRRDTNPEAIHLAYPLLLTL